MFGSLSLIIHFFINDKEKCVRPTWKVKKESLMCVFTEHLCYKQDVKA